MPSRRKVAWSVGLGEAVVSAALAVVLFIGANAFYHTL